MEHFILSWDLTDSDKYQGNFRADLIEFIENQPLPIAINIVWWVNSTIQFSSETEGGTGFRLWLKKLTPCFNDRNVYFVLGQVGAFKSTGKPVIDGDSNEKSQNNFNDEVS